MRFWSSEYPLHQAPSLRSRRFTVDEREHNFNTLDTKKADKTAVDLKADKTTVDANTAAIDANTKKLAPISNSAANAATQAGKEDGNIGIGTASAATEKLEVNGKIKADDLKVGSGTQLIASLLDTIMPIGSIIPWHKNIKKPDGTEATLTLPAGWIECNGDGTATINDAASPLHGFLVPSLNTDGRFLRGGIASGVKQDSQNLSHEHYLHMRFDRDPASDKWFDVILDGEGSGENWAGYSVLGMNFWNQDKRKVFPERNMIASKNGGSESRPINMSVVYIMRIK